MKAMLKTTFERYGKYITGHIEDAEMYEKVKSKVLVWKPNMWQSITHIRVPKEVFIRLLKLDRSTVLPQQCWVVVDGCLGPLMKRYVVSEHHFVNNKLVQIRMTSVDGRSTYDIGAEEFGSTVFFDLQEAEAKFKALNNGNVVFPYQVGEQDE